MKWIKVVTEEKDMNVQQHKSVRFDELKNQYIYDVHFPKDSYDKPEYESDLEIWREKYLSGINKAYDHWEAIRLKHFRSTDLLTDQLDLEYLLCNE